MAEKPTSRLGGQFFRSFCEHDRVRQNALYEEAYPTIAGFVYKNNGNREDAEDLFQEGLLALLPYCERPDFTLNVSIITFLYAICRNIWRRKLEKKGREKVTLTDTWEYIPIAMSDEDERRNERLFNMHDKLERLRDKDKETIKGFYMEGKSLKVISEELGFANENSAKVQKFKSLVKLRKLMLKDPDFD